VWTHPAHFQLFKDRFGRFLMTPTRSRSLHPINIGCHDRFRSTNPIKTNQIPSTLILSFSNLVISLSTHVLSFSTINYALTLICCFPLISMTIEGILAGMSMLEQTKVLLSWQGPPWVGVHWSLTTTLWKLARPVALTSQTGLGDWSGSFVMVCDLILGQ
jgi:hypothetical protein